MNRSRKMALLLAAGAVGISLAAAAQQQQQQPGAIAPPPRAQPGPQRRRVTLPEALQLAAKQSPDIAAARATAAIAEASVRRAWTTWQPDISAVGTFDHTSAPSSIPAGTLGRIEGDEIGYNQVAAKVMADHGIPINDLHAVIVGY